MFRFWDVIMEPVVKACEPTRILEIGALRGENTKNICATFSNTEVVVVDPVPSFDYKQLEQEVSNLRFYKDLSLNVIPVIGKFDVGIIDGDHNWYTVYNELKSIEVSHSDNPDSFPVLIFHDIGWPYGRRDLYYNHATIPDEYVQPYAKKGMRPGSKALAEQGGLNRQLHNAIEEGGPRNGVLTAIEDFLSESSIEFVFKKIPVYFGYGILIPQSRMQSTPALKAEVDKLFEPDRLLEIMKIQESVLIAHMVQLQSMMKL